MSALRRGFTRYLLLFWFFGWISYSGWCNPWYSNTPEQYRVSGKPFVSLRSAVGFLVLVGKQGRITPTRQTHLPSHVLMSA